MLIGVPRSGADLERRVSVTPDSAHRLREAGYEVVVQTNAGSGAYYPDHAYQEAGADIVDAPREVWAADLVAVVIVTEAAEEFLRPDSALLGLLEPLDRPERVQRLASTGATLFAFELLTRSSRAQSMDALSSQATAAGYAAVLLAAEYSPRFFPMLTTAAGTVPPAQVLVLGAGVAGLQAIATARRLGATVTGYDIRTEAREEVESLGARFLDLGIATADASTDEGYARELEADAQARQLEHLAPHVQQADIVVTTAAVPGRRAPLLVTTEMVEEMSEGAVVLDAAAANGGNCQLTEPDEVVRHNGVVIAGPTDLASRVPAHASQMYGRNVVALIEHVSTRQGLDFALDDEIVESCLVAHQGRIVHPAVADRVRQP